MKRVLFVCLANICRSPAGEGVLRHLAKQKGIDVVSESCGIGSWSEGAPPDSRMTEAALARGIVLEGQARVFDRIYFDTFDYILTVDDEVRDFLLTHSQIDEHKAKIRLITDFSEQHRGKPIPDPYYKGQEAFERVLDMLQDACEGLLQAIEASEQG